MSSSTHPDGFIYQLALKIRQSLDLNELLTNAATEIRQLLKADRVLLYRMGVTEDNAQSFQNPEEVGQVVVESVDPAWPTILGEVIHDPCFTSGWDQQYRQGRIGAIANVQGDEIKPCHRDMLAQFAVQANLVVPILQQPTLTSVSTEEQRTDTHLWGLLIVHQCSTPRQWKETEQSLLQQLAVHLAIAIQQAEQHQQLQRELEQRQQTEKALRQSQQDYQVLIQSLEEQVERRSTALTQQRQKANLFAEIALRIRQSLRLNEILQVTVNEVQKCLAADRVLLYQVFADGTGKTISEAVLEDYPAILDMSFPEEVFPQDYQEHYRQGRLAAIADVRDSETPLTDCLIEFVEQWAVRAKLIVPILLPSRAQLSSTHESTRLDAEPESDTLWGLLIAHQCSTTRQWNDFEIELCRSLANQVGVAIAQASFTQSLETRVQERTAQLSQALQETAESEEKFRQLAENIREVFFLKSADAQELLYISPAYEAIFGLSCEALYQDPAAWMSVVHPDDYESVQQHLSRPQETGDLSREQIFNLEYRIVRPDGGIRWISSRLFPISSEAGEVQRIAGIAEDISDRKRNEEAFKRSNVARSLVGDILRDLQSQAQLSSNAMFEAGQALSHRLPVQSLSQYLETFSLMGLGSLEQSQTTSKQQASTTPRTWRFQGHQLVEVQPESHSPTCHYARGFLCGAIARIEQAVNESNAKAPLPQAAAVEMRCCSMGDDCCEFVVQRVER